MNTPHPRRRAWQLACAALLTAASLPAYAAAEQPGEIIIIEGEQIPDCAAEYGIGYTEHFDLDGSFAGCACVDDFYCDEAPGYPGGGGPGNPGGGGGGGTPDDEPEEPEPEPAEDEDECADGGCTCEQEDPEPELCEVASCAECALNHGMCTVKVVGQTKTCEQENYAKAHKLCSFALGGAPDVESCIKQQLFGTSWTSSSTTTTTDSSTTGYSGNVDWVWGNGGLHHSWSESSTTTTGHSETTPSKPPNREVYRDCQGEAQDGLEDCYDADEICRENAEGAGESCDLDT